MEEKIKTNGNSETFKTNSHKDSSHHKELTKIQKQRQNLPIFQYKDEIIKTIREHQVLIIVGETGSGKSTQISQYLEEEGFADRKLIGITQPRRVGKILFVM